MPHLTHSLLLDRLLGLFHQYWGHAPQGWIQSPGRINLLGEHIDYHGGSVLPAAVDLSLYLLYAPRTDQLTRILAADLSAQWEGHLLAEAEAAAPHWLAYFKGMAQQCCQWPAFENKTALDGFKGMDIVFGSQIPLGGGLSSSAALSCAAGTAWLAAQGQVSAPLPLALAAQQAEQQMAGVQCGIMDMYACLFGQAGCFLHLDCARLVHQSIAFQQGEDYRWCLWHTGVKHALGNTAYNERRAQGEAALRCLQQHLPPGQAPMALAHATRAQLEQVRQHLDPLVWNKALYVVEEQARVVKMVQALQNSDVLAMGQLMTETHWGLSQQYEVSCAEADFLVKQASTLPGVVGARMMGGGFGGVVLGCVAAPAQAAVTQELSAAYAAKFGRPMEHFWVAPSAGLTHHRF